MPMACYYDAGRRAINRRSFSKRMSADPRTHASAACMCRQHRAGGVPTLLYAAMGQAYIGSQARGLDSLRMLCSSVSAGCLCGAQGEREGKRAKSREG